METIGSLIDKLTIANIRIWHFEERRRDHSLPDAERLKAADAIATVNQQRNDLIDEIDLYLKDAINDRIPNLLDPKNKLYESK